ncbi:hydroxyethylthiazole kinase [Clostridium oryzae]|uniref:Hydroxyethylthiazole kinase n=1 Tax=Clostridium oryzae TaxID=1450648 RepID=A0A1V4IRQ1_9CLOT|nr:hydroxyethylthiazole kinase [Clostridium oryzae]OPJ62147.1 hydroxyethylthiazole kinase [Clostridium oryzae]
MKNKLLHEVGKILEDLRVKKPLVHHLTNYVTVNDCANVTLAVGASPIMADDIDEVESIASISSALVINIGTLNKRTIASMITAGKKANEINIPVVFDPVGAGASELRNKTTETLLKDVKMSVIRGNMSEIRFVAGLAASTKGVDASESDIENSIEERRSIAEHVARKFGCIAAITGATDIVSDGERTLYLQNGTKLLSSVTGTGCMTTSLIASFCGASHNYLLSAAAGILSMSIAGELAKENSAAKGTGSFHIAIIDEISKINDEVIEKRGNIYEV